MRAYAGFRVPASLPLRRSRFCRIGNLTRGDTNVCGDERTADIYGCTTSNLQPREPAQVRVACSRAADVTERWHREARRQARESRGNLLCQRVNLPRDLRVKTR